MRAHPRQLQEGQKHRSGDCPVPVLFALEEGHAGITHPMSRAGGKAHPCPFPMAEPAMPVLCRGCRAQAVPGRSCGSRRRIWAGLCWAQMVWAPCKAEPAGLVPATPAASLEQGIEGDLDKGHHEFSAISQTWLQPNGSENLLLRLFILPLLPSRPPFVLFNTEKMKLLFSVLKIVSPKILLIVSLHLFSFTGA